MHVNHLGIKRSTSIAIVIYTWSEGINAFPSAADYVTNQIRHRGVNLKDWNCERVQGSRHFPAVHRTIFIA